MTTTKKNGEGPARERRAFGGYVARPQREEEPHPKAFYLSLCKWAAPTTEGGDMTLQPAVQKRANANRSRGKGRVTRLDALALVDILPGARATIAAAVDAQQTAAIGVIASAAIARSFDFLAPIELLAQLWDLTVDDVTRWRGEWIGADEAAPGVVPWGAAVNYSVTYVWDFGSVADALRQFEANSSHERIEWLIPPEAEAVAVTVRLPRAWVDEMEAERGERSQEAYLVDQLYGSTPDIPHEAWSRAVERARKAR